MVHKNTSLFCWTRKQTKLGLTIQAHKRNRHKQLNTSCISIQIRLRQNNLRSLKSKVGTAILKATAIVVACIASHVRTRAQAVQKRTPGN